MHLTAQLVRQPPKFAVQIILRTGELAELHDDGILLVDRLERGRVCPQGVCQHPGIAPVIFGAGNRVPVAKARAG